MKTVISSKAGGSSMTYFPRYLVEYPNKDTAFPFYLRLGQTQRVSLHRHDFLELIYVIEGSGTEIVNGTPHSMKPGTLVFLLPFQLHEIIPNPAEPLRLYVINFDMSLLADGQEGDWGGSAFLAVQSEADLPFVNTEAGFSERLHGLFASMQEEYANKEWPWRNWIIKARLIEILSILERLRSRPSHATKSQTARENERKHNMWPIIRYIHQNYREPLSLADLSVRFHIHPSYLSESIKAHLGQTFTAFLKELRIRHACNLLISTDMPITSVALEVGFGSYSTFCRLFHRAKGMPPVEYRKNKTGGDSP
jgi:AraC-like DNA-binding protein